MQFMGSVRLDGSKRLTLIKEVADFLEVGPQDHLKFYIHDGEVIIRKVLPEVQSYGFVRNAEFWEWARKKQIEINMMDDEDAAEFAQADLDEKISNMEWVEEDMKRHFNSE